MRILIINLILHTHEKGVIPRRHSNADAMIFNMARGFVSAGHEVTLIASEEYRAETPDNEPFSTIYLPSRLPAICKPSVLPWPKGLRRWLRSNPVDLIISSEVFSLATLTASLTADCPVLAWQELAVHQRFMKKIPSLMWYNIIAPLLMRRVGVVGRSENARRFISKYLPRVSDEVVDHGCNGEIFYPSEESEDSFVVISQLIPRKQPMTILRAFLDFIHRPGRENFHLHVIGKGSELEAMQQLVNEENATRNVTFHGFLSHREFAPISRRSKGMLVNTLMDLNMVSIPESIINGTPVLMNSVPYSAGYIRREGLGIVADNWGADELERLADGYREMHRNCIAYRENLTNVGCAKKLVKIGEKL